MNVKVVDSGGKLIKEFGEDYAAAIAFAQDYSARHNRPEAQFHPAPSTRTPLKP